MSHRSGCAACERFDEATARWCLDRLPDTDEPGWPHAHRDLTRLLARAPYFFPELHPTGEADERAAADSGEIQATGIRYVATKPAVAVTPAESVHKGRTDP